MTHEKLEKLAFLAQLFPFRVDRIVTDDAHRLSQVIEALRITN